MKIPYSDIKAGEQYQYEESYYLIATVTVLEDKSTDEHFKFLLRVDEHIGGMISEGFKPGATFEIVQTKDIKLQHYIKMAFKTVGSMPDYFINKNTSDN